MRTYSSLQEIRKIFDEHPSIIAMKKDKNKYARIGNYAMAVQTQAKIEEAWKSFLGDFEKTQVSFIDTVRKMDEDDRKRSMVNLFSLVMMADCFDFMLADIKETLNKYEKGSVLDQFDSMNKLSRESANQIRFLLNNTEYSFSEEYANNTDLLREMIMEKVGEGMYSSYEVK